jgi:glycerophosphoryl diester phosphodiesterase
MLTFVEAFASRETLVFGHRGASAYAPMNTLPAFLLAAEQGAAGIELDVRRSSDGQLMILHDPVVDHTTNGSGRVADLSYEALRELDAGAWFGPEFTGTLIPTLDEVFDALGGSLLINVEIKAESMFTDGIERAVAETIRRHRLFDTVLVSSFNPLALRRFRAALPEVMIGYLHAPDIPFYLPALMSGLKHEARHPYDSEVTRRYMDWAQRAGYAVNVWTVNDPVRAQVLRDLGVNAIITDRPDAIRAALAP